jgi:2-polyprenyl-3-methyl-5-hydroxy-6-metoxy-1,4-benzoquinol methylase
MSSDELDAFYKKGYRTHAQQTEQPTKKDLVMQRERAKYTTALITPTIVNVDRHLDIGSSSGALLQKIREAYNSVAVGIEPGDVYRSYSEAQGITTYSSLSELPTDRSPFDLISMMHVVEHLPDPVQYFETLRREYLSPRGYLLIEVPNLLEHEALELGHLFAFTPSTLEETVRQAGFEVVWTKTHGSFRSPILKLFIALLAQVPDEAPGEVPVKSRPFGIRSRRNLGTFKRELLTRYLPDWTWQSPRELWD